MDHQDSQKEDDDHQGSKKNGTFKVKLGFFFGYNGQKFQGMQYQRQHGNTIQNTVHALLLENGFMLKSNAHELKRIRWSRAARTDKKVHALCNGISLRVEISQKYVAEQGTRQIHYNRIIKDLNDQLPMDIRILALRKVGKSFDMRHDAKTRIYNYIIPSRLFQSFANFKQKSPIEGEKLQETIVKLNQLVKNYIGTHNFFNFTRGYKKTDPRCERYLIKMSAQKVEEETVKIILRECFRNQQQQYESFIRFTLVGQSFIYHQIRKMIGLLIKIFSQQLQGEQTIKQAFKPQQFDVYLAPGQGLYLNRMTFQSYNNRRDTRQKIQFTEEQEQRICKYRSYLETKIIKHQIEQSVFSGWLAQRKDYDKKQQEQEVEDSEESGGIFDSPDPGVVYDGNFYYAATTGGWDGHYFPIWQSKDLFNWTQKGWAFLSRPVWADRDFWAPQIHIVCQFYQLYYTATDTTGRLCIGVAYSQSPTGPYIDKGVPLLRNGTQGVIDPTIYQFANETIYLLYKVNGNDKGAPCQLHMMELSRDGRSIIGQNIFIFRTTLAYEHGVVEAPWVVFYGEYFYLFYSSCAFNQKCYNVAVSRSRDIKGPYQKYSKPILSVRSPQNQKSWYSPGHCSVLKTRSGNFAIVYHAWPHNSIGTKRLMLVDQLTWQNGWPKVRDGYPSETEQPNF